MKCYIPIVLVALLLAACGKAASPATLAPTPSPTSPPPTSYFLNEVTAVVGPALRGQTSVYQEYDTGSGNVERSLGFYGISSGHVALHNIGGVNVSVLGVYMLMQTGEVLEIPVVTRIGDDSFVITPTQQVISTTTITDDLRPISVTVTWHSPFERGAAVMLTTANSAFVQPNGLDWGVCSGNLYAYALHVSDTYCRIGQYMDEAYPDGLYLLTLRALQEVPDGWVLTGFVLPPVWGVMPMTLPEVSQ